MRISDWSSDVCSSDLADLDPATLDVAVLPVDRDDPDHVALEELAPWLTVVADRDGREHAVLSDGWRHIRLDVEAGTLAHGGRVLLLYRIAGRSEEHTSELPSLMRTSYAVFCLKKKK